MWQAPGSGRMLWANLPKFALEIPMPEPQKSSIRWMMIAWVAVSLAVAWLILKAVIGVDAVR